MPITSKGVASPQEATPFLRLRDAVVRRAGNDILRVDDFTLEEGQSIALLGPNGSGKSTFVNLITREVMPLYRDEPPVLFRGNPLATFMEVRRALGIVSAGMQSEISVHLPVREIVAGGLTGTLGLPFHVPDDEARRALEAAGEPLAMLGIDGLADRDVMTLSTGQARRVLVARALISNPDVLVFDEPSTGLDPEGMFYIRRSLRTLAQMGKGIILVTHYPEDVIPEIGRLVLMKDGRVFADGPKEDMLTSRMMSDLFDIAVQITCTDGYYSLASSY